MTQPAITTDPICGMDVDANGAKLTSHFNGQTYAFCSAGCKQMFDRDPGKYLSAGYKPSMLVAMWGRVRSVFWDRKA